MRPVFILLALAAAGSNAGLATVLQDPEPQRPVVRFGLVIDGPWDGNDRVRELFETEIRNLLQSDFQPEFPPDKRITADWTLESVSGAVDQLLTDPDVDIFLAIGPVSSQVTAARTGFEKPAVAAFVLDAALQGLPSEGGGSGVPNLSYVSLPLGFREDFEIARRFSRWGWCRFCIRCSSVSGSGYSFIEGRFGVATGQGLKDGEIHRGGRRDR